MPADPTGFRPETYGQGFADVYDDWYGQITDADATAAFVADRAPGGRVAELGIGSGRLVDALAAKGLTVIGLDASAAMLAQCRSKVEGKPVTLVQADLAALPINPRPAGDRLGAALCAFNTLFNLPTEDAQQELFARVGSTLEPSGVLIIEAVTGVGLEDGPGSSVGVSRMEVDRLVLSATVIDAALQVLTGQHVEITEAGIKLRPWRLRWTTPDQLDAIAERAGMALTERYSSWQQEPFDDQSETHISCYRPIG